MLAFKCHGCGGVFRMMPYGRCHYCDSEDYSVFKYRDDPPRVNLATRLVRFIGAAFHRFDKWIRQWDRPITRYHK